MTTTFNTKTTTLPMIALAIIISLSAFLFTSCGGGNDKPATATVDSTKASFKILGTWVSADDPANKAVFTADSITTIEGSKGSETHSYKWVSDQEIEVTGDKTQKAQIAINGDSLTMTVDNKPIKLIRDGSTAATNTVTPATTDTTTANEPALTPEAIAYKNDLLGTWYCTQSNETIVFVKDTSYWYHGTSTKVTPSQIRTYKVASENNLDFIRVPDGHQWKASMDIQEEGNKVVWKHDGQEYIMNRVKAN